MTPNEREQVAICLRILGWTDEPSSGRTLAPVREMRHMAATVLEGIVRRYLRDLRASEDRACDARVEFADYQYDAESAREAWERN